MYALIIPAQVFHRTLRPLLNSQSNFVIVMLEHLCIYQGSVAQGCARTHTLAHPSTYTYTNTHMLLQRIPCHKQWYWEGGMCCSLGNSELVGRERRGGSVLTSIPLREGNGGTGCQVFLSAVITLAPINTAESSTDTVGHRLWQTNLKQTLCRANLENLTPP